MSRRQFLRGDFSGRRSVLRPPWAVPEELFRSRCVRCSGCVAACPQRILVAEGGGLPRVDFRRGECTFCGECAAACRGGALERLPGTEPWQLAARVLDACLARNDVVCRSCGDACEPRAIRFAPAPRGVARPSVDEDACSGCGACVSVCPAQAITVAPRSSAARAAAPIESSSMRASA